MKTKNTKQLFILFSLFLLCSINAYTEPTLTITYPTEYVVVPYPTYIQVQYENGPSLAYVHFDVDGQYLGTDTTVPYAILWGGDTYANGYHTIKVSGTYYAAVFNNPNDRYPEIKSFTFYAEKQTFKDSTPPTNPILIDDGTITHSLDTLHVKISSSDPQSGILKYRYAVVVEDDLNKPGAPYTYSWKETPQPENGELNLSGLNLINGKKYYIAAKAINRCWVESEITYSDGITAAPNISPFIRWISPRNPYVKINAFKANQTINITATGVDPNGDSIQYQFLIDGTIVRPWSDSSSYPWVVTTQDIGIHAIVVEVKDNYGGQGTGSIKYEIIEEGDITPPSITFLTPQANSQTKSTIVYGRCSLDTNLITISAGRGYYDFAQILDEGYFLVRAYLTQGSNTVIVRATDKSGNQNQASINITYNTTTPKVTITSPLDNSTIDISPIKVEGTNTSDIQFILVNSTNSINPINSTNFVAEGVTLDPTKTVITATGYDATDNKFQDAIVINSPNLSNYELQKVSGDAPEDDPNRPQAGSNQILKVKLEKNSLAAINEEIQFQVTQGTGTLFQTSSFTDINGEAQVTLTTDTNSDITNQVEAYPTNNPLVKATFYVDTKPGAPAILTKITDDSITPVPGATIDLIVKLTDQYQNPIQDETINFQVISGDGTLSSPTAVTTYYGEAKVNLTCPNIGLVLTQVKASSNTNPLITTTFNITTSEPLTVTVDDIIAKVNYNDSKIQDIKADITVTSNAEFLPPTMQLKIWQKGEKQKVEEVSPNPQVKIRPPLETSTEYVTMQREIISSDPTNNVYVIRSKQQGQAEEYPYQILYVDYNKGVELKSEYYTKDSQIEMLFVIEAQNFIQINDAWVAQRIIETAYEGQSRQERYRTENVYTNIQINTGIPDSEFQ